MARQKKKIFKKNLDKAKDHFSRYIYIYANDRLSNALKIQLFKAVILPQVLYGLDVFNLTKTDYEKIETWINVKIKNIIKVNIGTPTDIIRWETRTEPTKHMILKRKAKFLKKLKKLELEYLNKDLKLDEIEGIDWENMEEKEIKERLHETHIKTIQNKVDSSIGEKNWKLKKYLKIAQFPNNFAQKQPYLSWKSSTTLFKLKSFSNGLCRYIYKWEPGIDSKICPCCNKKVDDVDHFIWKCEKYEKTRKFWKNDLKNIKGFDFNIITREDTDELFRKMNVKVIYDITIEYLITNMTQHAIRKNALKSK
ncbi:hypothetical protein M0812_22838 [Anaeramoeba flamelloides]|uniref:Reverse transcriptase zinc-binding domain-containing protein n=1 Tax=Anaeramoeba flamelloides TaxID=1746091 RepID=A0AAV7YLK4_9EUKA|nr:hypothetical protein M0812_22838 [Anaeramoeba flamelloides]